MVKANDIYNQVKLPVDKTLVTELLTKFFSISMKEMSSETKLSNLLYKKINFINENSSIGFDKDNLDKLLKEINEDFITAGKPYDIAAHGGVSPLGIMPGWNIFQSWNLLGGEKIASQDIAHRFYFAIKNNYLYDLAKTLYDEFKAEHIPFYFKTEANETFERCDKLVLYTSNKYLDATLKVIEKVKEKRPNLFANLNQPSILMGKITEKIGYATEDTSIKTSYTDNITNSFVAALKQSTLNINPNIKALYDAKLKEYQNANIDISKENMKLRILVNILVNNDPNYIDKLEQIFKQILITKNIDPENICFNNKVKQKIENKANITLPNGKVLTVDEYLKINNVYYWCPKSAKVILKNGNIISGEEFILGALSRASKFNNFQDIVNTYCTIIDRNANYSREIIENDEIKNSR